MASITIFNSIITRVAAKKLEYDYPVYWTTPLTEEKNAGIKNSLTRRGKKDKALKDLLDRYVNVFDFIIRHPNDYKAYLHFCDARLNLDLFLISQMCFNYTSRFIYNEKVFQKIEIDLFCLNTFNGST